MPSVLIVIPMYLSFAKLRLVDNLAGLVISYVALTLPYSIWLLRAFFKIAAILVGRIRSHRRRGHADHSFAHRAAHESAGIDLYLYLRFYLCME